MPFGLDPSCTSNLGKLLSSVTASEETCSEESVRPQREMRREQVALLPVTARGQVDPTINLKGL